MVNPSTVALASTCRPCHISGTRCQKYIQSKRSVPCAVRRVRKNDRSSTATMSRV
jgi:hypothetical protein